MYAWGVNVEVEEIIRRADADLEEAEAQLRAAMGRVNELRTIRDGLRYALQRYGTLRGTAVSESVAEAQAIGPGDQAIGHLEGSQTDQVFETLAAFGRPAKTQEVFEKLQAAGAGYTFEQVRNALGYLVRKKKIKRVGRALWEPSESTPPTDFAPATEAAGASQTGEGPAFQVGAYTGADRYSYSARPRRAGEGPALQVDAYTMPDPYSPPPRQSPF